MSQGWDLGRLVGTRLQASVTTAGRHWQVLVPPHLDGWLWAPNGTRCSRWMRWMRRRLRARGGGADSRVHRPRALAGVLKGRAAGWALDGDSASRRFPCARMRPERGAQGSGDGWHRGCRMLPGTHQAPGKGLGGARTQTGGRCGTPITRLWVVRSGAASSLVVEI